MGGGDTCRICARINYKVAGFQLTQSDKVILTNGWRTKQGRTDFIEEEDKYKEHSSWIGVDLAIHAVATNAALAFVAIDDDSLPEAPWACDDQILIVKVVRMDDDEELKPIPYDENDLQTKAALDWFKNFQMSDKAEVKKKWTTIPKDHVTDIEDDLDLCEYLHHSRQ